MTYEEETVFVSTTEAARILGYCPATLRNSRWTGMLAGVPAPVFLKVGAKSVRYQRDKLMEWLRQFSECTSRANFDSRTRAS